MKDVNDLMKRYGSASAPPRIFVIEGLVFTEDRFLLGKVHS
ncbi:MAG: hypothetical protein AABW88_02660 [Nanoarchaeota archaeon]